MFLVWSHILAIFVITHGDVISGCTAQDPCASLRGHSSEDRVGMMMSSALRAAGLHPLPLRCGRRAPPRPAVTAVSAEPDRGRAMSAVAHDSC